ncbi:hypothetical protein [Singulisphaera sp. PoT]|uniref:hypothetical protein n=1 Tax=Singulisphaera sp. PoT TaxID=3411797 RepID=UPI003BF4FF10
MPHPLSFLNLFARLARLFDVPDHVTSNDVTRLPQQPDRPNELDILSLSRSEPLPPGSPDELAIFSLTRTGPEVDDHGALA